jgi:hypothetical protein
MNMTRYLVSHLLYIVWDACTSQVQYGQKHILWQNGGFADTVGDGAVGVGTLVPATLSVT